MGSAALLIALVVLAVGGIAGWQMRNAYGANSDLKVHKARIPNFRKARAKGGLTSVVLIVFVLLLLRALMR